MSSEDKATQDKKEEYIMTQYSEKSYKMASDNTKYNADGKAVIPEMMSGVTRKNGMKYLSRCRMNRKTLSSKKFHFTTNFTTNRQ